MDVNPYQPPAARLVDPAIAVNAESADLVQRFLAALLDGVIHLAYVIPIAYLLGIPNFAYVQHPRPIPSWLLPADLLLGCACFVLVHGWFLHTSGQTVGKKVIGIRIVDLQGRKPPLYRLLGMRYLPTSLVALVPVIGNVIRLVDVLVIFNSERRCIHDVIAGTRVVKL
jgi:uncharacterized RDD family membrane protein YckC